MSPPRGPGRDGAWLLWSAVALTATVAACKSSTVARFPHELHLAGMACGRTGQPECLSCSSCHSMSSRDELHRMPDAALCERCHRDAHATRALLAAPARPFGEIHFDHDRHLALSEVRGQCVPCHAGVVEPGRAALPPMKQCFSCHEHQDEWEALSCTPCHERQDLVRTMPVTFLKHDDAFVRHHGELMTERRQALLCQTCHTQAQCQECHDVSQDLTLELRRPERIEAVQVHRGDFMVRHGIEARSEPARCLSCHTTDTCDSCHALRGVSANLGDSRSPHPREWVGTNTASSNFHGVWARRDILSCAACHEAGPATNCIPCHKVGAYGGNPHPRGWKSARGENSAMCRYCHG
jgi:hypothetical protein